MMDNDNGNGRYWVVPGALYQASLPIDTSRDYRSKPRDSLSVGATYSDKESMVTNLGLYHLKNRVEYAVERSSQKRFSAKCKYPEQCHFLMRATCHGTVWRVIKWNAPHTCLMDFRRHAPRTLSSKVIGAFFSPTLMNEGATLKPKEMASQLQREYGFQVDYSVALAGRNHASKIIYGDPDNSFQMLPSYLYMVQHTNPGSIVDIQTDSEDRFEYCFMALGASINGFISSGRPVIVVDATHLKGKYKGVMFIAATKDGNEQIFPLAVGLGDKENDDSWTWFLRHLKSTFHIPTNLLIVSDQHPSIKNAIEVVYPGIPHGLCVFHLKRNLAKFGEPIVQEFEDAAYSYKVDLFQKHMNHMVSMNGRRTHKRLMDADPSRWARSLCPVRRYDFMTSNCVEVINARIRWARMLPVCTLLECVRTIVGKWFAEKRSEAEATGHELTNWAAGKLNNAIELGRTMSVEPISALKFKVEYEMRNYVVDLVAMSCSCMEFDHELIPCSHAAAAICKAKQSCISYVSSYYTTKTWRDMYSTDVNPIPHQEEWQVPVEVSRLVVGVPINPKQSGRPRVSRFEAIATSSRKAKRRICSRCNKPGHYRSSCREEIPIFQIEEVVNRVRRRKRCSICHQTGHTKRKCSQFDPSV